MAASVVVRTESSDILGVIGAAVAAAVEVMDFKERVAALVDNSPAFSHAWQTPLADLRANFLTISGRE